MFTKLCTNECSCKNAKIKEYSEEFYREQAMARGNYMGKNG